MQSFTEVSRGSNGLNLSIDVHGAGPLPSKTKINAFSIAPFPSAWLRSIQITSQQPLIENPINVESKHWEPNSYILRVNALQSGLITLNQAYDKNWIAFQVNKPWVLMKNTRVDSWANGWKVPAGEYYIVLLYWPQTITLVGYTALVIGILISLQQHIHKRTDR
jgi:uncharacterized membrane protein YfhO